MIASLAFCSIESSRGSRWNFLPYFSSNANASNKSGRYIKSKTGYRLERSILDDIKQEVKNEPKKVQVSQQLTDLVLKIKDSQEKAFLVEALNCYRVEAYRATIILVWILAIDHLQKYIFGQKLNDFNAALAKNPDKKVQKIVNYDDFSDLSEGRFVELTRSANIISNDVRKILDEKLGIRNSAAHPSGIVFTGHKTTEFGLDIINNILLKYSCLGYDIKLLESVIIPTKRLNNPIFDKAFICLIIPSF